MEINFPNSWKKALKEEFQKEYFVKLMSFVNSQYSSSMIYPPFEYIFRAFEECTFENVKVVILGQDPYHTPGVADGLAFSSRSDKVPPSLQNIFKEISAEFNIPVGTNPDLTRWATQGVLLLNSTLTVQSGIPASHKSKGWEIFSDAVIKTLSDKKSNMVFLLWGNLARSKKALIDSSKHLILESPHPSPFSAYTGFFGNNHFKKCNEFLKAKSLSEINWN